MVGVIEKFQSDHPIQMQSDEIEVISETIKQASPNALMVEWGSGASTIKWLQTMGNDQRLISIEHNREWFFKVKPVIEASDKFIAKSEYYLCEPNGYWDHGYGYPAEENPVGLDNYFAPTQRVFDANVFLIDGVARVVCTL